MNMTRSLRVLKISVRAGANWAFSVTCWLILITSVESILTIIVFASSSGGGGGAPGGGGCGTAAFSPLGVKGVMVMKMTSRTRRISMNGVTLISPFGEPDTLFL